MFNIEELIEKWGRIGLLQGLPEHLHPTIVLKYELTAMYLIDMDLNDDTQDPILTCTLPIISRIYSRGRTIGDPKDFINQVRTFFNDNYHLINQLDLLNVIDVESEMCFIFVERYYQKQKLEPIKMIIKHKL